MAWVYVRNRDEPSGSGAAFTVGFYDPEGAWHSDSDHPTKAEAAARVRWLNGGNDRLPLPRIGITLAPDASPVEQALAQLGIGVDPELRQGWSTSEREAVLALAIAYRAKEGACGVMHRPPHLPDVVWEVFTAVPP